MNYKLLAILVNILLILWLSLFYIEYTNKIRYIKESFISDNIDIDVLNYQMSELDKNSTSIDELQSNIETTTRKLNILSKETNQINRLAYIFKYVTIITISLLIFMICIFILDFDFIKGTTTYIQKKSKNLYQALKNIEINI